MAEAKMTVKQWLAKTWTPVLYLESRFLYAIGNTPMEDLLSGFRVEDDVNILLLGAGDIRHVLKTVAGLGSRPEHAGKPKTMTFHLNDVDPVIVARDVVLFQIVCDMDPDNDDDLSFLWCVWYNMELSDRHFARLMDTLDKLCLRYSQKTKQRHQWAWEIGNLDTQKMCIDTWKSWRVSKYDQTTFRENRKKYMILSESARGKQREEASETRNLQSGAHDRTIESLVANSSLQLITDLRLEWTRSTIEKELTAWYTVGSIIPTFLQGKGNTSGHKINPTLIRPGRKEWCLHYASCPFDGYNTALRDRVKDRDEGLADVSATVLRKVVTEVKGQMQDIQIKIQFWLGDCLELCSTSLAERGTPMNMIHTSNLADHVGLIPLLLCCSPLLKDDDSMLMTGTMRTRCGVSMQEYIDLHIGSSSIALLPTLLGVHLAEDFDLGTSCPPESSLFSAKEEKLYWVKAGSVDKGLLSLEDSPDLEAGMKCVMKKIAEGVHIHGQASSSIHNGVGKETETPLTALTFLERMKELMGGDRKFMQTKVHEMGKLLGDTYNISYKTLATVLGLVDFPSGEELVCLELPVLFPFPNSPDDRVSVGFSPISKLVLLEKSSSSPRQRGHFFSNYKFNAETKTVELLMLKSSWEAMQHDTQSYMNISNLQSQPCLIKEASTVKRTWPIEQAPEPFAAQVAKSPVQISHLSEANDSYRLELEVANSGKKIAVNVPESKKSRSTRIRMEIQCKEWCEPGHIDVGFSNVIDIAKTHIQVSSKKGSIEMRVAKHQLLNTGIYPLPRHTVKVPSLLPAMPKSLINSLFSPRNLVGHMFGGPDALFKLRGIFTNLPKFYALRESVQIMWIDCVYNPKIKAYSIRQHGKELFDMDIFVNACYMHNGIPLMHVTFIDVDVVLPMVNAKQLLPERLQEERARRSKSKIDSNGRLEIDQSCHNQITVDKGELHLWRRLLYYNAHLLEQPPKTFQPNWLKDSFIQLYFPRFSISEGFIMQLGLSASVSQLFSKCSLLEGDQSSKALPPVSPQAAIGPDVKGSSEQSTLCAGCGKSGCEKRCSKCKMTFYCSKECQQSHWSQHKAVCTSGGQMASIPETPFSTPTSLCGVCGLDGCRKKCSKCKKVYYCSEHCQRSDWAQHRKFCRRDDASV